MKTHLGQGPEREKPGILPSMSHPLWILSNHRAIVHCLRLSRVRKLLHFRKRYRENILCGCHSMYSSSLQLNTLHLGSQPPSLLHSCACLCSDDTTRPGSLSGFPTLCVGLCIPSVCSWKL
uniref:Uncharacterized protein n=1 Tax=Molossus molossus TaxID=27622 RepID=A0A7J8JX05_MOLMO|nr:hypothetical protein HJG59_007890 [Molossus molossus]